MRLGALNSPVAVVVILKAIFVSRFMIARSAAAMAAPAGSVTVPVMLPRSDCAKAALHRTAEMTSDFKKCMDCPQMVESVITQVVELLQWYEIAVSSKFRRTPTQ